MKQIAIFLVILTTFYQSSTRNKQRQKNPENTFYVHEEPNHPELNHKEIFFLPGWIRRG
jgi:hypothetical protein